MNPSLMALKAAIILAATDAKAQAKRARKTEQAFHSGRADAFKEALRLLETVSRIDTEGSDK